MCTLKTAAADCVTLYQNGKNVFLRKTKYLQFQCAFGVNQQDILFEQRHTTTHNNDDGQRQKKKT